MLQRLNGLKTLIMASGFWLLASGCVAEDNVGNENIISCDEVVRYAVDTKDVSDFDFIFKGVVHTQETTEEDQYQKKVLSTFKIIDLAKGSRAIRTVKLQHYERLALADRYIKKIQFMPKSEYVLFIKK